MDVLDYNKPCRFLSCDREDMFIQPDDRSINIYKRGPMKYDTLDDQWCLYGKHMVYVYSGVTDSKLNYFIPENKEWHDYGSLCKIIIKRQYKPKVRGRSVGSVTADMLRYQASRPQNSFIKQI